MPEMKQEEFVRSVTECADKVGNFIIFKWKPPELSPGSPWTEETKPENGDAPAKAMTTPKSCSKMVCSRDLLDID
jgi:hypothetical protein